MSLLLYRLLVGSIGMRKGGSRFRLPAPLLLPDYLRVSDLVSELLGLVEPLVPPLVAPVPPGDVVVPAGPAGGDFVDGDVVVPLSRPSVRVSRSEHAPRTIVASAAATAMLVARIMLPLIATPARP
jgi:hypothetical protein